MNPGGPVAYRSPERQRFEARMESDESTWYAWQLQSAIDRYMDGADPDGDYLHGTVYGLEAKTAGLRSSLDFHEHMLEESAHAPMAYAMAGASDPRPQLREDLAAFEVLLAKGRAALPKANHAVR